MKNIFFYIMTVLIWGSTWIAIKFQIDSADPMVSIAYRFLIASIILLIWCKIFKLNLKFSKKDYTYMGLQGAALFGFNYLFIYTSELYLTSGLTAVLFSIVLIMNVVNSYIFLGTPIDKKVVIGGLIGLAGIIMVFKPELSSFSADKSGIMGIVFCLLGTLLASFGNILSARNQKNDLPIIQTNAIGMGFGGIIMFVLSFITGKDLSLVMTPSYITALLYLSVFGSIAAFGFYLSLVGNIGPGRAAYSTLVFPIVALIISTIWEGYVWSAESISGLILVLAGNLLIIKRKEIPVMEDENDEITAEKQVCT
jgi:drug/metabolite transporter (DMT)-like permease